LWLLSQGLTPSAARISESSAKAFGLAFTISPAFAAIFAPSLHGSSLYSLTIISISFSPLPTL